jgi:hypothetical protein
MTVPRIESMRAPADMAPTVAPRAARTRDGVPQLAAARSALVANAGPLRAALAAMDCDPLELTSVLAAIDHVIEEEKGR